MLIIDATMITGLLILLTLTNIGETRTNIGETRTNIEETINLPSMLGMIFNLIVVTAILPFAYSAYYEVNREIHIKHIALMPKLTKELEIATEKHDTKKINELKKEIKHLKRITPKKIETHLQFMGADEAAPRSLFLMKLGFLYVMGALVTIMIISQIQFLGPLSFEGIPDEECEEIIKKIDELNQIIKNTPSDATYYDELVPVAKSLLSDYEFDLFFYCERLE